MNESASGSLLRRALMWVIVIAVAIFALKLIIGAVFGLLQFLFALVLLGVAAMAVLWVFRHI
jgi:hypothetical protein